MRTTSELSLLLLATFGSTGCPPAASNDHPGTTHAITGTVSGAIVSGVTLTLSGADAATTMTNSSGQYRFSSVRKGNYTVTPSLAGYTFAPTSRPVAVDAGDVAGQDFNALLPSCIATSAATLVACADAVTWGRAALIEVQGTIVCSGADACRAEISNVPVTIRGATAASIRRIDHHDYPLLKFNGTPSVVIENLTIDEDSTVPCTPVSPTNPPVENPACGPSIDVYGFGNATLDHVTVVASKSVGARLSAGGNVMIRHARFVASYLFGVSVEALSGGLVVENTLFSGIDSNAMVLGEVHGTLDAPLRISGCLFDDNHRDDVFYMCGALGNEQCGGGQLLLYDLIDFLRVEDTVMRFGASETTLAGGVEMNGGIHDVTFVGNDIHANTMWAVYLNPGSADVARISFVDNKMYENCAGGCGGVDIGGFPDGIVSESGTCRSAGCATVTVGALWALPGGAVSWATNDVGAPRVTVDGALASTDPNGRMSVAVGAVVILYDGSTEIDRVVTP